MFILHTNFIHYIRKMDYYAAGILPYIKIENKTYFLLGKDKRNKWSDFGGKSELKDNNSPKNTAIREFFEETSGCISTLYKTAHVLHGKNVKCLKGKSYTKKDYYMYLVNLEYLISKNYLDSSIQNFNKHHKFLKNSNIDPKYIEKLNLSLISIDLMYDKSAINNLRQVFYNTINIECNKNIIMCV